MRKILLACVLAITGMTPAHSAEQNVLVLRQLHNVVFSQGREIKFGVVVAPDNYLAVGQEVTATVASLLHETNGQVSVCLSWDTDLVPGGCGSSQSRVPAGNELAWDLSLFAVPYANSK